MSGISSIKLRTLSKWLQGTVDFKTAELCCIALLDVFNWNSWKQLTKKAQHNSINPLEENLASHELTWKSGRRGVLLFGSNEGASRIWNTGVDSEYHTIIQRCTSL